MLSLLAIIAGFGSFAAFASDDVDDVVVTNAFVDAVNIESLSRDLFGNVGIKSSEYLYNYDDSPDYVYVKYTNYGYAVYARETLELLEYASQGSLPYSDTGTKNITADQQIIS